MTRTSIRELVESWRPRYLKASRKGKSRDPHRLQMKACPMTPAGAGKRGRHGL